MKKLSVLIKDKTTLVLQENGYIGDIIDLNSLQTIDSTYIENLISIEKEASYQKRLNEKLELEKKNLINENNNRIKELQLQYSKQISELKILLDQYETNKNKEIELINIKNKSTINDLNNLIKQIQDTKQLELEKISLEISKQYEAKINELNSKITTLNHDMEVKLSKVSTEHILEKNQIKESYEAKNKEIQSELDKLKLQKSNVNVKILGEELEKWCNEEYESYAAFGFNNCIWEKDNTSVKDFDGEKATKADYIFRSYLNSDKQIELASVCCEMKNEGYDSKTKKKNSDHYAKLDKDRIKKNCEYALLISELEWDSPNDSPIKKARDYEKMYMVRPQYFITFLSLISSLASKYSDLINQKQKEELKLVSSLEIIEEFNNFKKTYIENPLNSLISKIEKIQKNAVTIANANQAIIDNCNEILTSSITNIKEKIERFNIKKISKDLKKLEL